MLRFCTILAVLIFSINGYSKSIYTSPDSIFFQNEIYATLYGLKDDKPHFKNVSIKVKSKGEDYLIVDRFENKNTKKLISDVYNIWGIKYENEYYFHLSNARGIDGLKKFIKIDKEDLDNKFFSFSLDFNLPIKKPTSTVEDVIVLASAGLAVFSTETGLALLIASKDIKSDEYWIKQDDIGTYVYIINTKKSLAPIAKRLNKKRLKKMFPENLELHKKIDKKEVQYEEIKKLIKALK